jgi:A/G-specific adenine glycosylase
MTGSTLSFARRLLAWYQRHRRELPWRPAKNCAGPHPDPYHVLVSESMLQQTQVATVIPYFQRFITRFPSLHVLAEAPEQEVLRLWQGLGYYSRARNLQRAAQKITTNFAGQIPTSLDQLLQLPGVGRYTAGAIASIAFGQRAPILDGNVIRVLCRLDAITQNPQLPAVREILWARAADILPVTRLSEFNSGLMELGALVCIPREPKCLLCPVRAHCQAYAQGMQNIIPAPKPAKMSPLERRWTFGICCDGKFLVEQRPATGRWASMWQFFTRPADPTATPLQLLQSLRTLRPLPRSLRHLGQVRHALTHRRYEFDIYFGQVRRADPAQIDTPRQQWISLEALDAFPMSRPQLKIAAMLKECLEMGASGVSNTTMPRKS